MYFEQIQVQFKLICFHLTIYIFISKYTKDIIGLVSTVDTAYIDNWSTEAISRHVDKQHRISTNRYNKYNAINGHVELQTSSIYDQFFLSIVLNEFNKHMKIYSNKNTDT